MEYAFLAIAFGVPGGVVRMSRYNREPALVYLNSRMGLLHASANDLSFDEDKFRRIRERLLRESWASRRHFRVPLEIGEADLLRVHHADYLQQIRNPVVAGRAMMLDYMDPWDDRIYEFFVLSAGGTLAAAEQALHSAGTAFFLGGGFHHAHHARAEGFCLINDVAVAIQNLRHRSLLQRVLVVDLDAHHGNGTGLFYADDEDVFTYSLHQRNWCDIPGRSNLDIEVPAGCRDAAYMRVLEDSLPAVLDAFPADLAIYLAGSDPWEHDPLGGLGLSEAGLLGRDLWVWRELRRRRMPVVILAAGGYGRRSWRLYFNFIARLCWQGGN